MLKTLFFVVGLLLLSLPALAQDVDALIDQARSLIDTQDYESAIATLTDALTADPENATAYQVRGEAYVALSQNQAAVDDFTEAINRAESGELYLLRAEALYELHRLDESRADYEQSIALDPNSTSYSQYGDFLRRQRLIQEALDNFELALSFDNRDPDVYRLRARVYRDVGDEVRSLRDLNTAVELAPDDPEMYVARGQHFQYFGDKERAQANHEYALELNPDFAPAYLNLAILASTKGDALTSLRNYNRAFELDPYNPNVYFSRALLLGATQQYETAIEDLTRALELAPDTVDYLVARGDAFRLQAVALENTNLDEEAGPYRDSALEDYTAALSLNPQSDKAYYGRALIYMAREAYAEALADFEAFTNIVPAQYVPESITNTIAQLRERVNAGE